MAGSFVFPFDRLRLSTWLSQFGLVYFCIGAFYGQAQANQGFLVVLVALLLGNSIKLRELLKDPLCITSLLFIIYVALRGLAAAIDTPLEQSRVLDFTSDWMMLGLLPALLVAAAIRITRFQPFHLLGLAVAGFLLKITVRIDWTHLYDFFERFFTQEFTRATFGYSVINLPLWALFLIICLIIYSDDYIRDRSFARKGARLCLFLLTINFLFFIIIIAKSRSIWIISCFFVPACILFKVLQSNLNRQVVCLSALIILLFPGFFIFSHFDFFKERLTTEREIVRKLIAADGQDIPRSSISERYFMSKVFFEVAAERPLLGWGPGRTQQLLERSGYPGLDEAPHFHNIFIETLLQLGLVGLSLFALMITTLFKAVLRMTTAFYDLTKFRWVLFCSSAAFILTGLINHTLWSSATPYFFTLMAGIAYAPVADRYMNQPQSPDVPS